VLVLSALGAYLADTEANVQLFQHLGVRPIGVSKDIQRYPKISKYIHTFRYPLDMFWTSIWDIIGYHLDISGYLQGYCQDILSISIDLQPVSRAIHLFIQRYPSTYP
jgi:hypothetical protein